jgi:hypothetical protein
LNKVQRSRLQLTAEHPEMQSKYLQFWCSSIVLQFDDSSSNFEEIKGSKPFVLARPFLFLRTLQQNILQHGQQPTVLLQKNNGITIHQLYQHYSQEGCKPYFRHYSPSLSPP